ncbi:cytochrome P450 [Aspergillus indologenus CBS 114.80]|uniref:Cytochrome P450 n=1 Tax=Aspergillus indologenus CBS 114.80 TaxID=1450541 RepID=A0A2V5HM30_9EURO|nr:cytochrome P450 [Aspergillus indologenus CBS 114.80]
MKFINLCPFACDLCKNAVILGALSGLLLHHGFFIKGEWHLLAPTVAVAHLCAFGGIACFSWMLAEPSHNFAIAFLLITSYFATLTSSIITYWVSFHRLRKFPGPRLAQVSKLWHVWKARHSRNYSVLQNLHSRYGDFVHTGPSEVTVFHPDVFMAIDGPRSSCIKAEWYDLLHPQMALVTARDKGTHANRRRQWNQGFSAKALEQYEAKFRVHIEHLEVCVAGDAQGGKLPQDPRRVPDVAHYLMEDARASANHSSWLTGDSILAVVAGSEPTVVVLVGIFRELGRNPTHAARIYQETRGVDLSDPRALLRDCRYLEAVITEALRLYPVLPTGGLRKTAAEGLAIGGVYILNYKSCI